MGRCCFSASQQKKTKEVLWPERGRDLGRKDNRVTTARYNNLTILPYSFFVRPSSVSLVLCATNFDAKGQFRHFSNAYFLIIFIIAIIGDSGISTLNWYQSPYESTGFLLSLLIVVIFAMTFEIAYDLGRRREDTKTNNRSATLLKDDGSESPVAWKDLRPGDFVKVCREDLFPADLLFLTALKSPEVAVEEFDSTKCYVETSNIDGETNLKLRYSPQIPLDESQTSWRTKMQGWKVEYDLPKPALNFSGVMKQENDVAPDIESSYMANEVYLDIKNILLRGSTLKNTSAVVGLVLYAGHETKGALSSSATRTKTSNAMILINRAILIILFVGLIMVLVSAGIASQQEPLQYLGGASTYVFGPFWSSFFTYIILYSNLLPISLIIATTITNFVQAQFIKWDRDMYDFEKERPAKCSTLELAQEIGQVSFVFSDKTGTLTRNEMKLVGCTIGAAQTFGLGGSPYHPEQSDRPISEIFAEFVDLVESQAQSSERERGREFLSALAICHTVLSEGEGDSLTYNAEGPDEEALVGGVAQLGFKLVKTTRDEMVIESNLMPRYLQTDPNSSKHKFQILAVNAFDSNRKRMSILIRTPTGEIELIAKGADSVMVERLDSSFQLDDIQMITQHLDCFAASGLRTLVLARRSVSRSEYASYKAQVKAASHALGEEKEQMLASAAESIETNMKLLGASAIEDRLQDGVPETLKCLRNAGIKTWVLTGDKVETAINIGYSSGLLDSQMKLIEITSADVEENLDILEEVSRALDPESLAELDKQLRLKKSLFTPKKTRSVTVEEEMNGEDPYGLVKTTRKIVENGFHSLAARGKSWRGSFNRPRGGPSRQSNEQLDAMLEEVNDPSALEEGLEVVDESDDERSEATMNRVLIRQRSRVLHADIGAEASTLALVVSGAALDGILHDERKHSHLKKEDRRAAISDSELKFLSVAKTCRVVVACRVSPRQKALLVRLVRRGVKVGHKEPITLAIGDGANDVAMIQEARVGVGIAGREGSQAVNSADFSIGQFRFLRKLLLVHGRWNYRRMAFLVMYIFYAHVLPVLIAFAYNFLNKWSGTSPYPFIWILAYSYIVVIPAIVIAALNRDISETTAITHPSIYISGRANLQMGRFKVIEYVGKAMTHACIICGVVYVGLSIPTLSYLEIGTSIYACILITVMSRLAMETYSWTVPSTAIYVLALCAFPVLEVIIYYSDKAIYTLWNNTVLFGSLADFVWSLLVLVSVCTVTFDVAMTIGRRVFLPNLVDVVTEIDRGYGSSSQMNQAVSYLDTVTRAEALPEAAVASAMSRTSVAFAPKFRSAFAFSHAERPPRKELKSSRLSKLRPQVFSRKSDSPNKETRKSVLSGTTDSSDQQDLAITESL